MSLNQLASKISKISGGKIADIKNVLHGLGQIICKLDERESNEVLGKLYMAGMGRLIAKKAKKSRRKNG